MPRPGTIKEWYPDHYLKRQQNLTFQRLLGRFDVLDSHYELLVRLGATRLPTTQRKACIISIEDMKDWIKTDPTFADDQNILSSMQISLDAFEAVLNLSFSEFCPKLKTLMYD